MSLYVVVDRGSAVNVYDPGAAGAPIRRISGPSTGLNGPQSLAVDTAALGGGSPAGNLYVGNLPSNTITVYGPTANGDAAPIRTIAGDATNLDSPQGVAIDSAGSLYVLNVGSASAPAVTVYPPGSDGNVAPSRTITGIQVGKADLFGLAVDLSDNLYVSCASTSDLSSEVIFVYLSGASGSALPARILQGGSTGIVFPAGMDFDGDDNLYVANGQNVLVFDPTASSGVAPTRTIGSSSAIGDTFSIAVDQSGVVFVTAEHTSVAAFAAGANGSNVPPIFTIAANVFQGMALDKPRQKPTPSLGEMFEVVARVLGGVAVDGGGIVIVGGVPIPVGPWGPFVSLPGSAERGDALIGLTIDQMAAQLGGRPGQNAIRTAALQLVKDRVHQMLESLGGDDDAQTH